MAHNPETRQIYKFLALLMGLLILTLGIFNFITTPGRGIIDIKPTREIKLLPDKDFFTILTLNVAGREIFVRQRIPVLLEQLEKSQADIIALQEVKGWFLKKLLKQPWVGNYHITFDDLRTPAGKLLVLSRFSFDKIRYYRLKSTRSRHTLVVTLRWQKLTFDIAVVHLDSQLEVGKMRVKQMKKVFRVVDKGNESIVIGDFNFGDGEMPDSQAIPAGYKDPWLMLKPGQPGFTWNREENPMAFKKSLPGEKSRRLDRIVFRSDRVVPTSVKITFNRPVSNYRKDIFPSDHFGVMATFKLKKIDKTGQNL